MDNTAENRVPSPSELARLFITPLKKSRRTAQAAPEGGQPFMIPTSVGPVAGLRWGQGPRVLLVHGWEGTHIDMLPFVDPLRAAGHGVVAIDLPAHGNSPGATATIPQLARALAAVADVNGPFDAVIAHSVGCAATVLAVTRGLDAAKLVLIAAPARYREQARKISDLVGFDEAAWLEMEQTLLSLDTELPTVDLPALAAQITQPTLMLHSSDDRVISVADSRATAACLLSGSYVEKEGLGHYRILFDRDVIDRTVQFVAGARD
jgi:pimeloyl-ACP methyl ester carboxylesterase